MPGWFTSLPLIGQILVGGAALYGLYYLSNLLRRPTIDLDPASRTYGFSPAGNFATVGQAVPVVYGRRKVTPARVQEYIETVGDDQFYYGLYLVSAGGAAGNGIQSVTDIKLNDQPIANFAEAFSEVRLGTTGQTKIPWFDDTRVTRSHGITIDADGTSSTYTMPAGTTAEALIVNLRFPSGLFTLASNGNLLSNVVNVTIEYRVFGAPGWTLLTTTDIREAKRNTFSRPFRVDNLTVARYEVRVTRNSTGDRTTSSQYSMVFDTVDTILYGNTNFPKFAMLGIRVKATDQLSGSAPRVTCLVEGRKVRARSGGAWTAETYTRNPVWHIVDAMTDTQYGGGAYIDDAKLDIPSLEAGAAVADTLVDNLAGGTEARYMNDAVFDVQAGLYDALDVMLRSFRATLIDAGNTYRLFTDQARSSSQLFGNHNILRGTFRNGFVSLKEEFTQVELVCFDQASDYTRETVRFPTTASPLKRKQVELPTITRLSQALREAKYHMNAISALSRWAQFDCFLEGLAAEVGDVVDVSHDVPQWGYPGRILASVLVSGTTYDLTVDRDDLPTPTDHRMLVRHETDLIETGTVVSLTGRVVRVSGLSRLPKARDSGYAYGPANQTSKLYQVQSATLTPAFDRRLFLVEYDAAIYDATGLVLPARSPSQLPNLQAPPGSVTSLTLAEQLLRNEQGIYVSRIQMTWNNPVWATGQGLYDHCEVWLSRDGGLSYAPIGEARESPFVTQTLPLATYWIKVVTVSTNIVKQTLAAAATASLALLGENANPSTVTGLANTFIGRTVRLTWNSVVDADIDYYEIRLNDATWGTADANLVGRTKSNEFLWPDRTVRSYTLYVRARDMGGRYSSASASTTPSNTAPAAIAAPTVTAYFQVMEVSWPASAETDVIGYDLHASQTTGFTPSAGTRLARIDGRLSQYYLFRADAPSQTWYFKVAPEDELSLLLGDQNYSAQGNASSGQVVTADLIDAIINTAKLGTGVVTNDKIAARTILMDRLIVANFSNLMEEPGFEDAGVAWFRVGAGEGAIVGGTDPRNGNGTLKISNATLVEKSNGSKQDIFVLPGDTFYFTGWHRANVTGGLSGFYITWLDKAGAVITWTTWFEDPGISWKQVTGTTTAPAGAVKAYLVCTTRRGTTTPTNVDYFFDDVLLRRLIGSSFIEDLAVTNAKIASLVADKISGGDITAATIGIGRTTDPAILIKGATREILIRDSGGTTRIRIGTPTVT